MRINRFFRYAAAAPLRTMLNLKPIRRRIIFELQQRYYDELDILVPLGHELVAPVSSMESWCSFSEIFLEDEYTSALDSIAGSGTLPGRWLDLGCHVGFFSLWLILKRLKQNLPTNCQALLIDADPRGCKTVEKLIRVNHLEDQLRFAHGAIASSDGQNSFAIRGYMSSSAADLGDTPDNVQMVKTLDQQTVMSLLSPPYDLIKIDVEGSEFDFLTSYQDILKSTKYLILEWHSWHSGGGGAAQINELVQPQGFKLIAEPSPPRSVTIRGKSEQCGLLVLANTALV